MLRPDQIRLAESLGRTRFTMHRDEWVTALHATIARMGLDTPERAADRSEFASRAGYACVYEATKLGQSHPE